MAAALPDELLYRVFCHVDLVTMARIDAVSRRWHRVARDPRLWRDATHIDDGVALAHTKPTQQPLAQAGILRRRLDAFAARSDGRIDRLALRLHVYTHQAPIAEADEVLRILDMLPTLGVRQLWLQCVGFGEERRSGGGLDGVRRVHTPVDDYVATVAQSALAKCSPFTELHVQGVSLMAAA